MNYIGISENRLHHILGVARKAYKIARSMDLDDAFCKKCFMLGWLHDVGYEFCTDRQDHPAVSAGLLEILSDDVYADGIRINNGRLEHELHITRSEEAILKHGRYMTDMTIEYKILCMADMQVDHEGKECTCIERLEGIKKRYGEHSDEYLTACDICYRIGLTAVNIAGNTT